MHPKRDPSGYTYANHDRNNRFSNAQPTPTTVSLTPGPTQTLPEIWNIEVQVTHNGLSYDPQRSRQFVGGKGLNFIQQIDVRVTRADGAVENGIIAKPLYKGKSVTLNRVRSNRET